MSLRSKSVNNTKASLLLATLTLVLSMPATFAQETARPAQSIADPSVQQSTFQVQNQIAIERGKPNRLIDGVGSFLAIPDKILLWNSKVMNHNISTETQNELVSYMQANGLTTTKVRINQYHPMDDWRRLRQNKKVGAGWRYTVGALYTFGETILPGRLVGADHYNPFTDTAHIYSDLPDLAMEQSALAKDVRSRNYPGTYATFQGLPLVGLWSEKKAKDDVLAYRDHYSSESSRKDARDVLHPQYGIEIGREIGELIPPAQPAAILTGAAVGHATGWLTGRKAVEQTGYEP